MLQDHIPVPSLTAQEQKILSFLADGLPNREIAEQLVISPSTVKWHIRQLNNKLTTNNRAEIVERATAMGLIHREVKADGSITDDPLQHSLPNDLTPFIGRDAELEQLVTILQDDHVHLLTLAGPGGIGKTRLAISLARRVLHLYPHGVYFIALAGKTTLEGVASSILAELNVDVPASTSSSDHLLTVIGHQQCLLILDNFEQLLDIASFLTTLLQASPNLTILVTSRIRLNLNAETVFNLHGLSHGNMSTAEHLLVERIRAHTSQPIDANNEHIKRICELTQGLPLALVLAATWSDTLELGELADEIENSIDILANDQPDIPVRQRSMRATLDYSWKLLSQEERKATAKLSLFTNGFQRDAAQTIAGVRLPMLKSLVRRSLLTLDDNRYQMHELIRQYALDILQQDEALYQTTQQAFSRYFANYVSSAIDSAMFDERISYADMILSEHDNILSTWDHMILNEDYTIAARLMRAMSISYQKKLSWHHTYELTTHTINLLEPFMHDNANIAKMIAMLEPLVWAVAWLGRSEDTNYYARMHDDLTERLSTTEIKVGASPNLPIAVAFSYAQQGDFQEAIEEAKIGLQRSLANTVKGGGTIIIVAARMLGELHMLTGDLASAESFLHQGLDAVADMDGAWVRWWRSKTSVLLGKVAYLRGDYRAMQEHFESFALSEDAEHDLNLQGMAAYYKAQIALDQQDLENVEMHIQKSIACYERTGNRPALYIALADSAYIQIALGSLEEAHQDLLYALEYKDTNLRVLTVTMLAVAYMLLSSQSHLEVAKSLLVWISEHPSTEFMIHKRAKNLIEQYAPVLARVDSLSFTNQEVLDFRQSVPSLLANLSHVRTQ